MQRGETPGPDQVSKFLLYFSKCFTKYTILIIGCRSWTPLLRHSVQDAVFMFSCSCCTCSGQYHSLVDYWTSKFDALSSICNITIHPKPSDCCLWGNTTWLYAGRSYSLCQLLRYSWSRNWIKPHLSNDGSKRWWACYTLRKLCPLWEVSSITLCIASLCSLNM